MTTSKTLLIGMSLIACSGEKDTPIPVGTTEDSANPNVDADETNVDADETNVDADETDADADGTDDDGGPADTSDSGTDTPDTSGPGDSAEPGTTEPSLDDCIDEIEAPLAWFEGSEVGSLEAVLDFGQTHVIREAEDRWAPALIEGRATMYLLTSPLEIPADADARVSAWKDGELLGVLPLHPPSQLPEAVEQSLSSVPLEPWSRTAWSAFLPYDWMEEGVELRAGADLDGEIWTDSFVLRDLGAPQRFTISRSKMVLFGEADKATDTQTAERIAQDFYSSMPVSHMRWVDSAPWRLSEIVVNAAGGPVLVHSEGERLTTTTDPDRWNIIKHQFALRMNLANTGRGLAQTWPSVGDSSPYSFGTSVASGWVMNDDGTYSDLDNAPYAAGWTGWTAMWLGECGNTFIHEIGHSGTLQHFTSGTASGWGIADEYPLDGKHVESHPWGFDTTREKFRTWYRVNNSGPVITEEGAIQGKRDPMNGGESANSAHCFPQYVPYQAWKIQDWSQNSETITKVDDTPGVYQWNAGTRAYDAVDLSADQRQTPIAVDVPVAMVVGTLGSSDEARRIYPPIHWSSANAFAHPDPLSDSLHSVYNDAQFFLTIRYSDGAEEHALIARPDVTDENLYLFSLNLEMDKEPNHIGLWLSPTGYPDIDIEGATLQYEMDIDTPTEVVPEPVLVGRGHLPNDDITLSEWCETGFDCDVRHDENTWRLGTRPIHFAEAGSGLDDTTVCSDADSWTDLSISVANELGETDTMIVRTQRIVQSHTSARRGPINDATPWIDSPNMRQSLRAWIPYEENTHIGAGIWTNAEEDSISVIQDGVVIDHTNIQVNLRIYEAETIDLAATFEGPSYTAESSSSYFVVTDAAIGPTGGIWWGDPEATPLNVPVRNVETGENTHLNVDAWKRSCWLGWSTWWNLNSAQAADETCEQWVHLAIGENEHLESGQTYASTPAKPVIFRAMGWHAGTEIARDAYAFTYTMP